MAPRFAFVPARWLAPDSGLNAADRLTLCILCQWVNRESGECFPSVATIAIHSKLSENTIRQSVKRLAEVGALTVERRNDPNGDSASNLYTILGYDPPVKGGTANQKVPVPQTGGYGTANEKVEVPQTGGTNVVKENKELNGAVRPDAPIGRAQSHGPRDLHGTPLHNYLSDVVEPLTEEQKAGWRSALGGKPNA
jgi:hypothetical protein